MVKKTPEKIFDEMLSDLRSGKDILYCQKKYARISGAKKYLQIFDTALQLPKKRPELDRRIIWNKIKIRTQTVEEKTMTQQSVVHPFGAFRLAFPRTIFVLVTIFITVGLVNATAVKAKNSLPGQTLYPIKRTAEKIDLILTIDDQKKTVKKIEHAEERLEETKAMIEQSESDDPKIPESTNESQTEEENTPVEKVFELDEKKAKTVEETLEELSSATENAADESKGNKTLLEKIVQLTDKQELILTEIEPKLSGDTQNAVVETLTMAQEKNLEAEAGLADIESEEAENQKSNENATTTEKTIEGEVEGAASEQNEQASTTDEAVEALGGPTSSTTEIIIPSLNTNTTESTTPEIIELK